MKRLEDKPFVILGVNSDSNKEAVRETMKKEKLTWRAVWDGGSMSGPIARKWNVTRWPTIYVLDHKGIIRHRDVREEDLDEAVDALLEELAAEKLKAAPSK